MTLKNLFYDASVSEKHYVMPYICIYIYLLHEGAVSFLQEIVATSAGKHDR